jgi:heme/copper-type cytochrome/quinol oxidase subunit 2
MAQHGNLRFRFVKSWRGTDRINQSFVGFCALFRCHIATILRCFIPSLTFITLTGCEGVLSTVDPAGPAARTIATLWWVMLAGGVLIFGLVMALLVLPFLRHKNIGDENRQIRVWIIGLGLAFPMVVLAALLAYGLVVGERLLPRESADVARVSAEARRSAWAFAYDDVPAAIHGLASRSLLAHLLKLQQDGAAAQVDDQWQLRPHNV